MTGSIRSSLLGWTRVGESAFALHIPQKKNLDLLDLATGTGDQLIACFEKKANIRSGVGIDLASEMLNLAQAKVETKPYKDRIRFQRADALSLPFSEHSFDAATFSFGIRNVSDPLRRAERNPARLKTRRTVPHLGIFASSATS